MDINHPINCVDLNALLHLSRQKHTNETSNKTTKAFKEKQDITFQILSWYQQDEYCLETKRKIYKIKIFGVTDTNEKIHLNVNNFQPFFFVELPEDKPSSFANKYMLSLVKSMSDVIKNSYDKYEIIKKHKLQGFTANKLFNFILITLHNKQSMYDITKLIQNGVYVEGQTYVLQICESNIDPFMKYMHTNNIKGAGWVKISKDKYEYIEDTDEITSIQDINITCNYKHLVSVDIFKIADFDTAYFDIECTSSDGSFPLATRDGDKIIQIGTTISKFSSLNNSKKHIITLGTCADIEDTVVVQCSTEKEVLLEWIKYIKEQNPDIIAGYNILGFDFEYMKNRSIYLGIGDEFSKLSRLKDEYGDIQKCVWKEAKLNSSAMGDNLLKYYDMVGRVIIDIYKYVQRDYKLTSYKLDNVVSNFIKETITNITNIDNVCVLHTTKTDGITIGQYIKINYIDGHSQDEYNNGKKYKILKIDASNKSLTIDGNIDTDLLMGKGYKISWSQAKDDIKPFEIFSKQKGTMYDRSIIAKYCIQDCLLCDKLMSKLQILTNSIGMANVCYVPMSYLFTRGQGIKIYSLVCIKCKEYNHIIPNADKTENEDEEDIIHDFVNYDDDYDNNKEIDKYEGATVLTPKPKVYYEPISVLDFASLYPRSMIEKNLSHECLVMNDSVYGNLDDYVYNEITYSTDTEEYKRTRKTEFDIIYKYSGNDNYIVNKLNKDEYKVFNNKNWLVAHIKFEETIKVTKYTTDKFAQHKNGTKGIMPKILLYSFSTKQREKLRKFLPVAVVDAATRLFFMLDESLPV